ncbi:MAG: cytochrome ubiquinol oxidase subunit I [Nitrososphaerales archaeon]
MVSMIIFDRFLFAFTIASHIILVSTSIGLIIIIAIAQFLSIRRNDKYYGNLAHRLTKVFAISFGVGTASGVVMAVELTMLFPGFMTLVSETGAVGLLYAEIFAFMLETFALVLYVYYSDAFKSKYAHWFCGVLIAIGTIMSAVFITMLNAWMNTPNGFDITAYEQTGVVTGVKPWAPFLTTSGPPEIAHVLSTTVFTGCMVIGAYFAYRYLRYRDPEERAMLGRGTRITFVVGIVTLIAAGLTGSNEMATLLQLQPLKYAVFDANTVPGSAFPERIFGTFVNGNWTGGIQIPGVQGFLASLETGVGQLPGMSQFAQSDWPPLIIHTTFDLMVLGAFLAGGFLLLWIIGVFLGKKPFEHRVFLALQIIAGLGSLVVYELGWVSDELGRQPWVVYNVLLVSKAANNTPSLLVPGILIIAFYVLLLPTTFYFFTRVFHSKLKHEEPEEVAITGGGVNL